MVKLNGKKIRFMVRSVSYGETTTKEMANLYGISQRRAQQLTKQFKDTGIVPKLKKTRRPKIELTEEEKQAIDKVWQETRRSSRMIWFELRKRGYNIGKNKIHEYLRATVRSIPNKNKQKKRKRCRYERKHSGSLVHIDWHRTSITHPHAVAIIDDSSRKVIACGEFKKADGKNSCKALRKAIKHCADYSLPIKQLNCDHDSNFINNMSNKPTAFMKIMNTNGIKLVASSIGNPQTNGKLERFWYEYDKHRNRFNSFQKFVDWYHELIHGELDPHNFLTPEEAFLRRMPEGSLVGMFGRLIKW
jgi:putative transposase